ncbi:MAG TPA: ROK family protein [Bryobacteraceae bacterium]|nr:ROK family protein [Bryobacteraceae bacterium]
MPVLGVDIGGTKIAAGVVSDSAVVLDCVTVPTRAAQGYEASLAQLHFAIRSVLKPDVKAIGLACPGPLNPKTGVVINPPNLPGWNDVPLARLVQKEYGLTCRIENDANAAGLAEARFGAARGCSSVFYATLSTGIGAGIIIDGKVYHGRSGQAAEGGHVTIDWQSAERCNCGVLGCVEALASGTAIARRYGIAPEEIATRPEILDEIAEMIGAWMGSIISLLDPDIIVAGGGMSQIGDPLFERLRRIVPTRTINRFAAETPIVPAQLGSMAGVLGAAAGVL